MATVAAIKRYQKTGRVASLCFRSRRTSRRASSPTRAPAKALLDGNNRPRLFQMYASYMKPIRTKEDIPAFRACQVVMKYGREFYLKADVEYERPPAPQSVDVRRAVGLDPNVKNLFGVWSASEQRVIDLPTSRSTTSAWRGSTRYSPLSSSDAPSARSRARGSARSRSVWGCATTTTGL